MEVKGRTPPTSKLQVYLLAAVQPTQVWHINQNEPNKAAIIIYKSAQTVIDWFEKKMLGTVWDW
jgi:hypothetical protein